MNLLQELQEKYIEQFANNVPFGEFLLNILITALLTSLLRLYYIRFGQTLSNRRKFAANFLPLALGTLLIIMIVKSSIALSLGLVGALSIVRFRAAIKDPEELTYLFIAIGIGLAGGANQPVLAIVTFALILALLYLSLRISGKSASRREGAYFIHIRTDSDSVQAVSKILTDTLPYVDLKRMHSPGKGLELSFLCKFDSLEQLEQVKTALQLLSPGSALSVVEQPDLA